jgi:hypothetical protein
MGQSQYDPGFAAFGGGSSQSVLHPIVLVGLILCGVLTFLLPRKYCVVPLILGLMIIPSGQNVVFGGFHLYTNRIFVSFGLMRMVMEKLSSNEPLVPGGFGTLDKLFMTWGIYRVLAVFIQYRQWGPMPNQFSFLWLAFGGYFLLRWLIRDDEDVLRLLKVFAVVALVAAVGMLYESVVKQNLFGLLGGVRLYPEIRNGRVRATGMFQHALLAGAFGGMMFPLFLWLWKRGSSFLFGMIGAASCVVIVFTASTSTNLMALMGSVLALLMWPLRGWMRFIRWGIVCSLVGLQLVMNAPVWFVLQYIDLTGGSSGWERANLIDNFLRHIGSWWLYGTHDNASWGWDMWDIANQFVAEGEVGGLVCLVCFIAMIIVCFRKLYGARQAVAGDKKKEWLFWLFDASLFAQIMVYFGISYYDQMVLVWYALLVMIGVVTLQSSSVAVTVPDASPHRVPPLGLRRPATEGMRLGPGVNIPSAKGPSRTGWPLRGQSR